MCYGNSSCLLWLFGRNLTSWYFFSSKFCLGPYQSNYGSPTSLCEEPTWLMACPPRKIVILKVVSWAFSHLGPVSMQRCFNVRTPSYQYRDPMLKIRPSRIPMLKIRQSCDRLIFNMGIPIPGKTVFILNPAPDSCVVSETRNAASTQP